MDFIRVAYKEKEGVREYYPALQAIESQDLVIRGGQFVAIWDEEKNLYSRRQSHVPDIIDRAFLKMVGDAVRPGDTIKKVREFDNQIFNRIQNLIRSIGDMGPDLDQRLIYADETPTKADAATFKMPYSLTNAPFPIWEEIVSTLYDPEERAKIEWSIGSILSGDAATGIQKFYVFFGPPGSGKSTIMNIIELIFAGHTAAFSAYDLGKADAAFSLEPFKNNPLVAIDQDGDLSRLELNKNINSIVSHDKLLINSKGKNLFEIIPRSTLFVGSNEPIKISNRKSGLFRRVVDINPSGRTFEEQKYHQLMEQVKFEIGAIAQHCLNVYWNHGPTYMSGYRSMSMMYRTNDIFNFVEDNRLILAQGVSLKQAHKLFVAWCEETDTRNHYKQFQFRDLLMDYFKEFHAEIMIDGERHRSWFKELKELEKFSWKGLAPEPPKSWLELTATLSLYDERAKDMPAQEGGVKGTPKKFWENIDTTLADIDTAVEHFVKTPLQEIIVDFDRKDENGHKSLALCMEEAAKWPPTYAEVSRSGDGLHLHYDYDGDVELLAPADPEGRFEIKTLLGGASLRRRLSLCNELPVARISAGLPLKEPKMITETTVKDEQHLRAQILKALRKGVHANTKSNVDFIKMVTDEAFEAGLEYDVSDMWDDIFQFAMGSSNQRDTSIGVAMSVKLKSEHVFLEGHDNNEAPLAFFDIEVFPNVWMIGYMLDADDAEVVIMVNPTAHQVEELLMTLRLAGWNNRYYDNHIMWAASMGSTVEEIYKLSQRIIAEADRRALFGAAFNAAYADGYDIASNDNMKSIKRWEIDLGLPHMENDHPWDKPVPPEKMKEIMEYLENDVRSTRAVFKRGIAADFRARQILAEISGLAVCNTNRQHTEKLIFGGATKEGHPDMVYTDLREMFPGYSFDQFKSGKEKSTYKGVSLGEGGLVRAKPGMYEQVVLLDVASMHPTSIVQLNLFGKYTSRFKELLDVRLAIKDAIKSGDYSALGQYFGGRLVPYLGDKAEAKALSDALKIVINSVYGLTAASFPNTFKDPRNIDNIVAKRGALFMVDLCEYLDEHDYNWVHVKTDSVKVVLPPWENSDAELFDLVQTFADKYGYTFEQEAIYSRFCLVNDAVYVAAKDGYEVPDSGANPYPVREWSFTGKQFQHPVVNKTLFTHEEILPRDYVEVKQVNNKAAMYLVSEESGEKQFVGRFGAFVPVMGGRDLLRIDGDKVGAVAGTKGHKWELDEYAFGEEMDVDYTYFQNLIDEGRATIEKFGSYATFTRP